MSFSWLATHTHSYWNLLSQEIWRKFPISCQHHCSSLVRRIPIPWWPIFPDKPSRNAASGEIPTVILTALSVQNWLLPQQTKLTSTGISRLCNQHQTPTTKHKKNGTQKHVETQQRTQRSLAGRDIFASHWLKHYTALLELFVGFQPRRLDDGHGTWLDLYNNPTFPTDPDLRKIGFEFHCPTYSC